MSKNDIIAGAVAGAVARFIAAPLDVLKIRFVGKLTLLILNLELRSSIYFNKLM